MSRYVQTHLGACRESRDGGECRVLLLGEDNPQSAEPEHALYPYPPGCAGDRLREIVGLDEDAYLGLWRTNLCSPKWSVKAARERSLDLLNHDAPWSVIVLLGAKVAKVFEAHVGALAPFTTGHVYGAYGPDGQSPKRFAVVALPHPSGRNRIWNDPRRKFQAQILLRQFAPEIRWGSL